MGRMLVWAALLVGGCASGVSSTGQIPPVTVEGARTSPNPLLGQLVLPPGSSLHPVVILLHGCGGIGSNQGLWADRLLGWGYGSLTLDSFTPRSTTSVCAADRQRLVTRFDRAGDAIGAARWLQSQPRVDGRRIAVLGNSHGGSTAETIASKLFATAAQGQIKAAIDYYGACRDPAQYSGMPLLALAGDEDTWGQPARTCTAFQHAIPANSPFELAVYPGAVHAFDNPNIQRRRDQEGHPMQYSPDAAADSFVRVHTFLDRTIGPGLQ